MELIEINSGGGLYIFSLQIAVPPAQSAAEADWGDGTKAVIRRGHYRSFRQLAGGKYEVILSHVYPKGKFLIAVSNAELPAAPDQPENPDADDPDGKSQTISTIRDNLVENHSVELGYDNAPATETTEEGTSRAFRCIVAGDNNSYGDSVCIAGNNNENKFGGVVIFGNRNSTYQSQTVFGDQNELTASTRLTVFGSMNTDNNRNAGDSFVFGNMNTVEARNTFTAGCRIVNQAKGGKVFGRYFTLKNSPENEYAFAVGDGAMNGTTPQGEISFIHRVFKKSPNPLYDPEKDSESTGTDSAGENQYVPERAYSTEYRGHLLSMAKTIPETGVVVLDHDQYARWVLTGTGTIELQAENWLDGDRGELIANAAQEIRWPADWIIPDQILDIWSNASTCWFELRQENGKIIIANALTFSKNGKELS